MDPTAIANRYVNIVPDRLTLPALLFDCVGGLFVVLLGVFVEPVVEILVIV